MRITNATNWCDWMKDQLVAKLRMIMVTAVLVANNLARIDYKSSNSREPDYLLSETIDNMHIASFILAIQPGSASWIRWHAVCISIPLVHPLLRSIGRIGVFADHVHRMQLLRIIEGTSSIWGSSRCRTAFDLHYGCLCRYSAVHVSRICIDHEQVSKIHSADLHVLKWGYQMYNIQYYLSISIHWYLYFGASFISSIAYM